MSAGTMVDNFRRAEASKHLPKYREIVAKLAAGGALTPSELKTFAAMTEALGLKAGDVDRDVESMAKAALWGPIAAQADTDAERLQTEGEAIAAEVKRLRLEEIPRLQGESSVKQSTAAHLRHQRMALRQLRQDNPRLFAPLE